MDDQTFELLAEVVRGQTARLRAVLDDIALEQRGSTFVSFVRRHLDAIDSMTLTSIVSYAPAAAPAKVIHGNKLARCRLMLTELHSELVTYRADIGRRDLPAGLLYLVDALIDDLLKASADPLIHLDGRYMYSTQRVVDRWSNLSALLSINWTETEPVIFNLPGLDPGNPFLSPVLAHEVGHSVIQRHDLVDDLLKLLDPAVVQALEDDYEAADPAADVGGANDQFQLWAEELLCDALATELTGPSFMFSVAVFFPASAAGQSGPEHPDPAQRFEQMLEQLDSAGWHAPLTATCPAVFTWLQSLPSVPPNLPPSPREVFLRAKVDHARPHIIKVARDYVNNTFEWSDFGPSAPQLEALLAAVIPPAELGGQPVPPWHVVLASWFRALNVHGDNPASLVSAVKDKELGRFALKTIEMSQVKRLWGAHAPTP